MAEDIVKHVVCSKKEAGLLPVAFDHFQKLKYERFGVVSIDCNGFVSCTYGYV